MAETSHEVVNIDKLTYAGNLERLSTIDGHPRYGFEKIDICDAMAIDDLFQRTRPDAVVHLAAESHVDRSIQGPGTFIQTNIVGTYNLLQAALAYWQTLPEASDGGGVMADSGESQPSASNHQSPPTKSGFRFHHVSTDEVYGALAEGDAAFCESSAYDPHSPYSASKAASDHLVRAWARTYGLPVVVSHCSNNYGPFQHPEKLIPMVISSCLHRKPIPVYGDGKQIRDWLHVDDHCRALRLVLESGSSGRTYNIGGHCELRNIDLVKRICVILDNCCPWPDGAGEAKPYADLIRHVADRPGHDKRYAIDATRISGELGWETKIDFDAGLEQTVKWYLDHQSWWQGIDDHGCV